MKEADTKMADYAYVARNISEINKRIEQAANESGRTRSDILLLAVTKTVDIPLIRAALDTGITDLGENKVRELLTKHPQLTANWHLIGHLQTNKVKAVTGKVKLIHSVDSLKLAEEINKRAAESGIVQDILVEVNMSGEPSKFGAAPEAARELIKYLWEMRAISVKGLMTVAPYVDEGGKNRDLFKKMRLLFVDINENRGDNEPMTFLSMGMSGDYCEAIEEGANIVRIGTSIFGERNYN